MTHALLLEEIAARSLDDENPDVAAKVATFLGRYGPAGVEERLWEHFAQWNETWRGWKDELRYPANSPFGQSE